MRHFAIILAATCLISTAACLNGGTRHAETQPTEQTQKQTQKNNQQYISQRLTHIYDVAFNNPDHDLLQLDSMFMSQDYNKLQNQALLIAQRTDDLVIDADHWVQGQEWTYPTMTIDKIENIHDGNATAHVTITSHIPDNESTTTQLILTLVYERGDWYIDNMQQYYEGELLDEKAWYKKYVDNDGKM
ncbi:MAG: hypothetical protein IJ160_12335 [Muribaculaceae bacterium]|nr:hypothetical protein [Muribaculaceae bacterium]